MQSTLPAPDLILLEDCSDTHQTTKNNNELPAYTGPPTDRAFSSQRRKGQSRLSRTWAEERPGRMRHGRRGRALNMDGHQSRPPHHVCRPRSARFIKGITHTSHTNTASSVDVAWGSGHHRYCIVVADVAAHPRCLACTLYILARPARRHFSISLTLPRPRRSFLTSLCLVASVFLT